MKPFELVTIVQGWRTLRPCSATTARGYPCQRLGRFGPAHLCLQHWKLAHPDAARRA